MKVCLPILGSTNKGEYYLANDFYKAKFYCLYNIESDEKETFSKNELMLRFGLDLRLPGQTEVINAIISPNMRPMAYKILHDNNILVYLSSGNLVEENIELLKKKELSLFDPMLATPASCGSSCDSCSSSSCSSTAE